MKQLSLKKFLALSLTFLLAISLFLTPVVARAEESRTLISYLNDFLQEQDMGEWLEKSQELMGQEVDLTIDLGPGMLMEADIAQALASLGLQIKYQADLYNSGAMAYNFLLYNKEEPANSLSLSLNILGENLLVDLPGILDKPISMSGDDAMDMASMFGPMPSAGGGVMALPEAISQNIEQAKVDFLAAKDNFLSKFDDLGESSSNFVVGELNEDLTVQSCSLAAADMEVAVLDFLQEIRASQALTAITDQIPVNVDDLSILSAPAMSAGGGEMEGEASSYEDEDFYDEDED
ncbi:MAG: hypothetical protein Q4D97_02600, partial [Eubacteriales bacterium]|nr:hypothetical protein [Eubacteriales bacterium]